MMDERSIVFGGIALGLLIIVLALIFAPPWIRARNEYRATLQRIHAETCPDMLRAQERQARNMIASWEADRDQWLMFRDSDNQEERNWANGALMRANRTASSFNNFMLEHSWIHGIPDDIAESLPMLSPADGD